MIKTPEKNGYKLKGVQIKQLLKKQNKLMEIKTNV